MPTIQRTRRRGLKRKRRTLRRLRQRGGDGAFNLDSWIAAVREHMKSIDSTTTIKDLTRPELAIPADAMDRDFLEAAARVRAALILVINQVSDEIVNYDGPIATVFVDFCSQTLDEEVAYLNSIENRLRNTETMINICDVTSYPLYIWYVAANTSPDIPLSVDFGSEADVRAALSEPTA